MAPLFNFSVFSPPDFFLIIADNSPSGGIYGTRNVPNQAPYGDVPICGTVAAKVHYSVFHCIINSHPSAYSTYTQLMWNKEALPLL